MNKKEIAEIKRRLKKEQTTITRLTGCYVDEQKQKVTTFSENFLNLEDEQMHKYLEIANKAFSGTVGNNLLNLEFPTDEEISGGMQQSLLALRDSKLDNPALLESFYDHIIETYDTTDHYLILLFYDTYDIPMKTSDNIALDESDEVYEYIIGCICPVNLSKPGLGYHPEENTIGPRIRDWVVGALESAFTFPCFTDRSTDIHHVLAYTKNVKEPHVEFWEDCLGVASRYTSTQKRESFLGLVAKEFGEEKEDTPEVLLDVQQNIHDYVEEEEKKYPEEESIMLSGADMTDILEDSGLSRSHSERVVSKYEEMFPEDAPAAEELYENRAIKNNELRQDKKNLQKKVVELNDKLLELGLVNEYGEIIDIVVRTRPGRDDDIDTAFVDGRKCLVIPLDSGTTATLNGEEIEI